MVKPKNKDYILQTNIDLYKKNFDSSEIDLKAVFESLGNRKGLIKTTINLTLKNFDSEMESLNKAILDKNYEQIVFESHKMKGYISTFGLDLTLCILFKNIEVYVDRNENKSDLNLVQNLFELSQIHAEGFKKFLENIDIESVQ